MAKLGCAKCGGKVKMATGGAMPKVLAKANTQLYGIPQENMGTSSQYGFGRKGGMVKKMEAGGASGCPKGYIWDGKKCTKIIIDSKIPPKKNPRPIYKSVYKPPIAKKGGSVKKMELGGDPGDKLKRFINNTQYKVKQTVKNAVRQVKHNSQQRKIKKLLPKYPAIKEGLQENVQVSESKYGGRVKKK
jgi:hypothetical protein